MGLKIPSTVWTQSSNTRYLNHLRSSSSITFATAITTAARDRYPQVRAYSAPARQGFARNYNLGIRLTRGQYVLILNNDTLVQPKTLDTLLDALRDNLHYGVVGPRLLAVNGIIQTVCARPLLSPLRYVSTLLLLDFGLPTGKMYDAYRRRRLRQHPSGPVPCLSGASLLVARGTLDRIGLLDEGYEFYFEDVEWCHRVQKSGQQVAYIAEASLTYLGDQSLSKVKVWAKQSEYRSALVTFRQYYHIGLGRARLVWLATALSFSMRFTLFKVKELIARQPCSSSEYAPSALDLGEVPGGSLCRCLCCGRE